MRMAARIIGRGILLLLGAGLALALYGVGIEPGRLVVREVRLASPDWPATAAPLRIAVISDIHAGAPHIGKAKIETVVRRTNEARPDLVLLLGDYVIHEVLGGRFIDPEATGAILADLTAPLGVYAVLGNHDWWYDGERVWRALESTGIRVLENQSEHIGRDGRDFWIAGLADDMTRKPDGAKTLAEVPPDRPVIVFMHDPAAMDQVPTRAALSLAGHTHGGQIYLPWLFPPVTPGRAGPRYAYGRIEIDDKLLFVTGGIGTSIIPVRINMPPEIVVITLTGKAPA